MALDKDYAYCLNTSTIKGQGLGVVEEIEIAAKAGYDGVEPWVRELDEYVAGGGSLDDLGKRIVDLGLSVENLIGFFAWVVDDDAVRAKGLEEARRNLEMARAIGCKRLAAPPFDATGVENMDLGVAGERYRALLELAEDVGVVPMVEFWGMSRCIGRLEDAVRVAAASGRREACVLADVFHMYKGGSPFEGLRDLGGVSVGLMHLNDYPAEPPLARITDADRVYPGDGVAPLGQILGDLRGAGYDGMLSLELFNSGYWERDALDVARTGLEKMRGVVEGIQGDG